jgi:hypothetical protein
MSLLLFTNVLILLGFGQGCTVSIHCTLIYFSHDDHFIYLASMKKELLLVLAMKNNTRKFNWQAVKILHLFIIVIGCKTLRGHSMLGTY